MKKLTLITIVFTGMAIISCNNSKQGMGIRLENLDTTVAPGDDFFQYATGGWNAAHPLTDEYARFGSFDQLAEENRKQLKDLIDNIVASDNEFGTNAQKIADLYKLVLDTARRDNEGLAPLKPWIDKIEAVRECKENPVASAPTIESHLSTLKALNSM
jgi:putative endopeptidase